MTVFNAGDVVVAKTSAQGMTGGREYVVVGHASRPAIGGDVVTYHMHDRLTGGQVSVVNLHVLAALKREPTRGGTR